MIKCPNCGHPIDLKEARIRSKPQNDYYWSVILQILSDELGYTKDEMHEILKTMFLSKLAILNTKDGLKEIRYAGSTKEQDTISIEDYYSKIRQWASLSLGIFIPKPREDGNGYY